jgi:CHAT domain-containing protein
MIRIAIVVSVLVMSSIPVLTQPAAEIMPLRFGETVEREIMPQERHIYRVRLEAGQFAKFDVLQKGCDAVLMIVASDNKNLVEIRNTVEGEGVESTSIAVEAAGEYELRILSFGEKTGVYAAKIAELRAATSAEINFTLGWRLQNEAIKLQATNPTADAIRQSIGIFERALEKFTAAGAQREQNAALHNIGAQYSRLGQRQKAIEYLNLVLQRHRKLGLKREESQMLESLGSIYKAQGKWQSALEYYAESIALAKEADVYVSRISSFAEIASIYEKLDELDKAESYYRQSLELAKYIKSAMYMAGAINGLGKVAFYRKNYPQALAYFQEAVEVEKESKDHRNEVVYINGLGQTYFALGETARSIEYFERSLNLSRQKGDRIREAGTYRQLGNIFLETGQLGRSEEMLLKSLEIYRQIEDPTNLAESLFSLARVSKKLGKLEQSQAFIEEALRLIESFRTNVNLSELRDSFSTKLSDFYGFYTELLMERHSRESAGGLDRQAWLASERGRARNLLNLLTEAAADISEGVDRELLVKEREKYALLNVRLENLTKLLSGRNNPKQVEVLRQEIETIKSEYQLIRAKIREKSPRYAALTQPEPVSVEALQRETLDAETALITYSLGSEKSYLWFITRTHRQVFELPQRALIEAAAQRSYGLLTARNTKLKFETSTEKRRRIAESDAELAAVSAELGRVLLGPVEKLLGNKRLLIVADGALQYIPFSAIRLNGRYLVETNEIVNLPSASALSILRRDRQTRIRPPKTAVVLADPVFDVRDQRYTFARTKFDPAGSSPATRTSESADLTRAIKEIEAEDLNILRLPYTRKEADAIAKLVAPGQRKIAVDFAATRRFALSDEMSQFAIVHFATHGILNNKNPELSGLVLSLIDESGNPLNGFLRTDEVFNMKLSAELVVLSGCKTGLGKEIRGEGLIGLTRGFMYAGASRVLVSLWDVNDEATAALMTLFYQNLLAKKMNPARALREAQLAILKDKRFSNPYFSMAFTLHGEY